MKWFTPSPKMILTILIVVGCSCFAWSSPGAGINDTYVLEKSQYPARFKKNNPAHMYIIYSGPLIKNSWSQKFFRKDTIINLKGLLDSSRAAISYRAIFESRGQIDSIWQTDALFRITDKAFPAGEGQLRIFAYDNESKITDQFVFNYAQKYKEEKKTIPTLKQLMRIEVVYTRTDRNKYAAGAAWVLSIGVDEYEGGAIKKFNACESDAVGYNKFFRKQYGLLGLPLSDYHEYLLLGRNATKETILGALKDIAAKAAPNDYFIFCFAGYSQVMTFDSANFNTYFFPYDKKGITSGSLGQFDIPKEEAGIRLISLKMLQEHIQLIQARNQLFISEAGPSETFKPEFIRTMMQNSPAIATMLNINRVIIVPNGFGREASIPGENKIAGIINHCITRLDSAYNIYDIFEAGYKSSSIAALLKAKALGWQFSGNVYFDVFFEKNFLQQYRDIFGDDINKTRGGILTNKEIQKTAGLSGKRHALVIGTDHYKGKGWDNLKNPVYDATEIADILKGDYDYEVLLLKDPPLDSVYAAIRHYYKTLEKNDHLIVYVAGHGDYDKELLDDGFIVCADSKSVEDDPLRNTYIQHTKLKKMINKIRAKQILVMLDICHGGVFDDQVRDNPASRITNRNILELLRTNSDYTVRKVLSSVGLEAAFDGKAGKHSPFAAYLISILNARGGLEGIVTLTDIHALLQKASLNETATLKISPHLAGFGDNNPLGEFILIPAEGAKATVR
ncbi:MAG: caspase family protein [Bacteroidota bacterium]